MRRRTCAQVDANKTERRSLPVRAISLSHILGPVDDGPEACEVCCYPTPSRAIRELLVPDRMTGCTPDDYDVADRHEQNVRNDVRVALDGQIDKKLVGDEQHNPNR